LPKQERDESDECYRIRIAPVMQKRWNLLRDWEPLPTNPCTVLDPFAGSGTVGKVCARLGRHAVLLDIAPKYVEMQRERVKGVQMEMLS